MNFNPKIHQLYRFKLLISGFHNFQNPYGGLNIDRQFLGIPLVQLAAVLFAAIAFGGVAAQNGAGDLIRDIIGNDRF